MSRRPWKPAHRASQAMIAAVIVLSAGLITLCGGQPKARTVDSGTFGIFVRGQRVATESFQIQESGAGSTSVSEFKTQGTEKAAHRAELQMSSVGDLRRYEWRELSPGKAHLSVEPSDGFLIEQITPNPPEKVTKHPFMLPASTVLLDDYCFSHREILAWRYLAQACGGKLQECRPAPLQFGALVPQQRTSMLVTVEYGGLEKMSIAGRQRELNRLNIKSEDMDWVLYLDQDFKLVRLVVPSEQTEVVRD